MLNKLQIKQLIETEKLIQGYISLDKQLAPNGFDLTVGKVFEFSTKGALDFSNKERLIPETKEIIAQKINPEDKFGWWDLLPGSYKLRTNETVNIPNNLAALSFNRTSLLRIGVFTEHGVWDAGFKGKGEFMLVVKNPQGVKIKENARVAQLVFLAVDETESYQGIYNNLQ